MFKLPKRWIWGVAVTLASLAAGPLPPAAAKPPAARANTIDPAAIAAFERMGAYLAGLKSFEIKTDFSFDVVTRADQTISVDGTGTYLARRPDRLKVEIDNDLFLRTYLYNGRTLTIVSPEENFYAQVDAPPTIREMLELAATELGMEIPLADLFDLGTPDSPVKHIRSAFNVGTSVVNGTDADHWAFRGPNRDWEIWIATGDKPLPHKFVLVDRNQPTRPRYTVTLRWTENPDVPDSAFEFDPSGGHKRIEVTRFRPARGGR